MFKNVINIVVCLGVSALQASDAADDIWRAFMGKQELSAVKDLVARNAGALKLIYFIEQKDYSSLQKELSCIKEYASCPEREEILRCAF